VRHLAILLLVTLAAVPLTAGCTDRHYAAPPAPRSSPPDRFEKPDTVPYDQLIPRSTDPGTTVRGTFLPYTAGAGAITYDPAVVPAGAVAAVTVARAGHGIAVRLAVSGLVPRRSYGAHLHTASCTGAPPQAGPHYQHVPDPKAAPSRPSMDPSYANPGNEVWLDFTADAQGAAVATESEDWTFDETRPPRSLVVHASLTRTENGVAGMAGPRVACLTLPPEWAGHLVGAKR
jgi:Cu-Zn family superoxide dismutase